VLVIAASNCAASVVRKIAAAFDGDALAAYSNVDAVASVAHWSGCAIGLGEELAHLRRALGGVAQHPNVAGYVLVSLGCEANQLDGFIADERLQLPMIAGTAAISIQEAGGMGPSVQAGIASVRELLALANRCVRTEQPASKLNVALECGGSDSYSGLTANPVAGAAADLVVAQGGTAVFGETPEVFGAEHTLTRRAASAEVGEALLERIRWWEGYAARNGVTLDNNPSPGNKAGGLTTIYEKSLGAVSKGGRAPLAAVYQYAEPVTSSGLCFMDTPGYDPPSVVGMVAGGANLVIFTTGRGSAFGLQPVPLIKVATNTPLAARMPDIIDLDAGRVLSAGESIQQTGEALFDLLLAVASGERTRAEINGVGEDEFVPWIPGAVL
jgi:altronate hydrolase